MRLVLAIILLWEYNGFEQEVTPMVRTLYHGSPNII